MKSIYRPLEPESESSRWNYAVFVVIASQRVGAKRRPMTGSAKQSIFPGTRHGLLRFARNDGYRLTRCNSFTRHVTRMSGAISGLRLCRHTDSIVKQREGVRPHCRGAMRPGFASVATLKEKEGAGKTGCALHPRSRVQKCTKKRTRAYRFSGGNPAFPARWFTAYSALSLVTGLSCHHHRRKLVSANLTPASGRQDHTASPSATPCVRLSQSPRPPHPPARS